MNGVPDCRLSFDEFRAHCSRMICHCEPLDAVRDSTVALCATWSRDEFPAYVEGSSPYRHLFDEAGTPPYAFFHFAVAWSLASASGAAHLFHMPDVVHGRVALAKLTTDVASVWLHNAAATGHPIGHVEIFDDGGRLDPADQTVAPHQRAAIMVGQAINTALLTVDPTATADVLMCIPDDLVHYAAVVVGNIWATRLTDFAKTCRCGNPVDCLTEYLEGDFAPMKHATFLAHLTADALAHRFAL